MLDWLRKTFWQIVAWFRPEQAGSMSVQAEPEQKTEADVFAAGLVPPPQPEPPKQVVKVIRERRVKWLKPKGLEKIVKRDRAEPETKPQTTKPRIKRPAIHASDDDPEQWGQYYFRDQILDQLEVYFDYLKRMKHRDRDAYEYHRKLGMCLMPQSAIKTFDQWRTAEQQIELSAWWKQHRPAFGAVVYAANNDAESDQNYLFVAEAPPSAWSDDKMKTHGHLATITGSDIKTKWGKAGLIWFPKFLYFTKYNRRQAPRVYQYVPDGDVYTMTVYWDHPRKDVRNQKHMRKGGVPQDYGIWVSPDGEVRLLNIRQQQASYSIRSFLRRSGRVPPTVRWVNPTEYLDWCHTLALSPRNMLRNLFIEAALMYENASLGSMVRVAVSRDDLAATFGVEIKRMAYFFKDRDVAVTVNGKRKRIFHIVRPHMRMTKKGETPVTLHFRGEKQFEWGGYKVAITVPGLDHFHLAEIGVGAIDSERARPGQKTIRAGEVADVILEKMKGWSS